MDLWLKFSRQPDSKENIPLRNVKNWMKILCLQHLILLWMQVLTLVQNQILASYNYVNRSTHLTADALVARIANE